MKTEPTRHEILLFTRTSFASRELCSRTDEKDNDRKLSSIEKLEKACWEGMLYEMYPELPGSFATRCEIFIWNISRGENFLCIEMGGTPESLKKETAINPYYFLQKEYPN
jgi:hypothetical protein